MYFSREVHWCKQKNHLVTKSHNQAISQSGNLTITQACAFSNSVHFQQVRCLMHFCREVQWCTQKKSPGHTITQAHSHPITQSHNQAITQVCAISANSVCFQQVRCIKVYVLTGKLNLLIQTILNMWGVLKYGLMLENPMRNTEKSPDDIITQSYKYVPLLLQN